MFTHQAKEMHVKNLKTNKQTMVCTYRKLHFCESQQLNLTGNKNKMMIYWNPALMKILKKYLFICLDIDPS